MSTYKSYRRTTSSTLPLSITPSTEPHPGPLSATQLLLRIHAVSLNFRDVAMLNGRYPAAVLPNGIPGSDCAAEVIDTGAGVTKFKKGDRVSVAFNLARVTGNEDTDPARALGGEEQGVLREYAVFEEDYVVRLADELSWEEGSLLACAGVTAWTALNSTPEGPKGRSALFQGTGGVSMFALVLCLAAGITPIVTSSSDKKIEAIRKQFGTEVLGINYKTTPDIEAEVMRLTEGKGVDVVINNTGPASIPEDIACLRKAGGCVSLVGFLKGMEADWSPAVLLGLMGKTAVLRGIAVGNKADFEDLSRFIGEKKIDLKPLIDRVFSFDESKEAFDYLYSGQHVGKVVIKI